MKKIPGKKSSRTRKIFNPNEKTITEIRWLFCCLIFLCASCKEEKKDEKIFEQAVKQRKALEDKFHDSLSIIENQIVSGDIITRTGNDFTSESLRSLNQRDKTFSHCGIASREGDSLFVLHSIGGEWNPDEKIRKDPFLSFVNTIDNNCFGVYRIKNGLINRKRMVEVIHQWIEAGIKFDMHFDLKTDDRMYCAEMVAKCMEKASEHRIKINRSKINDFEFIGVDDVFLDPNCKKLALVRYK